MVEVALPIAALVLSIAGCACAVAVWLRIESLPSNSIVLQELTELRDVHIPKTTIANEAILEEVQGILHSVETKRKRMRAQNGHTNPEQTFDAMMQDPNVSRTDKERALRERNGGRHGLAG